MIERNESGRIYQRKRKNISIVTAIIYNHIWFPVEKKGSERIYQRKRENVRNLNINI